MHRSLLSAVLSLSVLLSPLVAAQEASYTFTTIDPPGGGQTHAHGINDSGEIVGLSGPHGFLKDGATFTFIDVPGATHTQALGINTAGEIVGNFRDTTGVLSWFSDTGRCHVRHHRCSSQRRVQLGLRDQHGG
jgi:uncharacterized membrane protein